MPRRDNFVNQAMNDGYSESEALDEYYENEGPDYEPDDFEGEE